MAEIEIATPSAAGQGLQQGPGGGSVRGERSGRGDGQGVRKRSSIACEACRARRIKCIGGIPCEACRNSAIGEHCLVRAKARPRRALSSKLNGLQRSPTNHAGPTHESLSSERGTTPRRPLDDINVAMVLWCLEHEIPYTQLEYKDEHRLRRLQAYTLPLPADIAQFEDQLMETFVESPDFDHLRWVDRPRLLSLYGRYRAIPNSISDDQKSLLYAALCLARFNQIHSRPRGDADSAPVTTVDELVLEDVTYFTMACQRIATWNQPSIYALWALFCLVPYSMANGGGQESRELIEQMAWHVRELGLHNRSTASLYPPQDMVDVLFSAFIYTDTFAAGLLERQPALQLREIPMDPTPSPSMFPECLRVVTMFEAEFLEDLFNPNIDTTSSEYITDCEAKWSPELKGIRATPQGVIPTQKRAWAELRYNWLRIMLYSPQTTQGFTHGKNLAVLSRVVSQILHIYADVDTFGHFRESWPQLRQLTTCAHLLILCMSAGEFHHLEAVRLWELLLNFLERHGTMWPASMDLVTGLQRAASVFGIELPAKQPDLSINTTTTSTATDTGPLTDLDASLAQFNAIFPFDFDPAVLFTTGLDGVN